MIKSRALGALKLASEARDENVPAKRADFFNNIDLNYRIFVYPSCCESGHFFYAYNDSLGVEAVHHYSCKWQFYTIWFFF